MLACERAIVREQRVLRRRRDAWFTHRLFDRRILALEQIARVRPGAERSVVIDEIEDAVRIRRQMRPQPGVGRRAAEPDLLVSQQTARRIGVAPVGQLRLCFGGPCREPQACDQGRAGERCIGIVLNDRLQTRDRSAEVVLARGQTRKLQERWRARLADTLRRFPMRARFVPLTRRGQRTGDVGRFGAASAQ